MFSLSSLESIEASFNLIEKIEIQPGSPSAVRSLALNDNRIESASGLFHLHNLEVINLSNNLLTSIRIDPCDPPPNLNTLVLSHNQIEEFPDISHVTSLTCLDLKHNKIKTLPMKILKMKSLVRLIIPDNDIQDILPVTGINIVNMSLSLMLLYMFYIVCMVTSMFPRIQVNLRNVKFLFKHVNYHSQSISQTHYQ